MIHWRSKMSVDGGVIDQDHKHLIEIINRFEKFAEHGLTREEGMEILFALRFYASTHFRREEGLQLRVNYSFYEAHKKEHEALISQLDMLIKKISADDKTPIEAVAFRTSVLLEHWLMDHVLHSDMKLRAYVEAIREHGAKLPPLDQDEESSPAGER